MNRLYYVALYNHRANHYVRVMVTAPDRETAGILAKDAYDDRARVETVTYVCDTPEGVCVEL